MFSCVVAGTTPVEMSMWQAFHYMGTITLVEPERLKNFEPQLC